MIIEFNRLHDVVARDQAEERRGNYREPLLNRFGEVRFELVARSAEFFAVDDSVIIVDLDDDGRVGSIEVT